MQVLFYTGLGLIWAAVFYDDGDWEAVVHYRASSCSSWNMRRSSMNDFISTAFSFLLIDSRLALNVITFLITKLNSTGIPRWTATDYRAVL